MLRPVLTFAALLSAPVMALAAGPGSAIGTAAVAEAIFAAHPGLAGDRVELPEHIQAHGNDPVLIAGALEHWGDAGAMPEIAHVRLRCEGEGMCLPFYAMVYLAAGQSAQPSTQSSTHATASAAVSRPQSLRGGAASSGAQQPPLVRSGDHVLLLIDSGPLHLRIHVTCLASGVAGSTIRVAGPNRREVYQAAVVDRYTVRGTL